MGSTMVDALSIHKKSNRSIMHLARFREGWASNRIHELEHNITNLSNVDEETAKAVLRRQWRAEFSYFDRAMLNFESNTAISSIYGDSKKLLDLRTQLARFLRPKKDLFTSGLDHILE